jgi:hypothetical protein
MAVILHFELSTTEKTIFDALIENQFEDGSPVFWAALIKACNEYQRCISSIHNLAFSIESLDLELQKKVFSQQVIFQVRDMTMDLIKAITEFAEVQPPALRRFIDIVRANDICEQKLQAKFDVYARQFKSEEALSKKQKLDLS